MLKILKFGSCLISETDLDGMITYANQDFGDACEFDVNLMLGFSHNIIRSDDMPAAVFKDIWDTIKSNKKWSGILKNSTFNGTKSYWVMAVIEPIFDKNENKIGYRSTRRQATEDEIEFGIEKYNVKRD